MDFEQAFELVNLVWYFSVNFGVSVLLVFLLNLELNFGVRSRHIFGGEYCSVRLADLIRTRNAMVFLFSLAEVALSRVVNNTIFGIVEDLLIKRC